MILMDAYRFAMKIRCSRNLPNNGLYILYTDRAKYIIVELYNQNKLILVNSQR